MSYENFADSCIPIPRIMQEEIVDETDEYIDVANRYATKSLLSGPCAVHVFSGGLNYHNKQDHAQHGLTRKFG